MSADELHRSEQTTAKSGMQRRDNSTDDEGNEDEGGYARDQTATCPADLNLAQAGEQCNALRIRLCELPVFWCG